MLSSTWKIGLLMLSLCFVISKAGFAQEQLQLQPPTEKDFVAPKYSSTGLHPSDQLTSKKGIQSPQTAKSESSFSWFIGDKKRILAEHPRTFKRESREYWIHVKGNQLKAGVSLPLSAAGALVRINPQRSGKKSINVLASSIDPMQIELIDPNGKSYFQSQGMLQKAKAEDLITSGSPFPEGTSAFKIKPELGSGKFKVKTTQDVNDEEEYLISVLEKQSSDVLTLQMSRPNYHFGQSITVNANFKRDGRNRSVNNMKATLRSPGGQAYQLEMVPNTIGGYHGKLPLSFPKDVIGGLWEVDVSMIAQNGKTDIRRMGKTAFSYSIPTARLLDDVSVNRIQQKKGPLTVQFNLDVAVGSRFEVRAILYATDSSGRLHPAVVSHSAAWLDSGYQKLNISFPLHESQQAGLHAPYEIRQISLIDQKQLALLHRQASGIRLE